MATADADARALSEYFTDAVSAAQTKLELGGMSPRWEEKLGMSSKNGSCCSALDSNLDTPPWQQTTQVMRQSHDLRKTLGYLAKMAAYQTISTWTQVVSKMVGNVRSHLSWRNQTVNR